MAHLSVRNFGPIQELELEIQDFMVLIGPNGSGKSTIAKLVYFFQEIPQMYYRIIATLAENHQYFSRVDGELENRVYRKFVSIFGNTDSINFEMTVKYKYNDKCDFSIKLDQRKSLIFKLNIQNKDTRLEDFLYENRTNQVDKNNINWLFIANVVDEIFTCRILRSLWQDYYVRFSPAHRSRITPNSAVFNTTPSSEEESLSINQPIDGFAHDRDYTWRIGKILHKSGNDRRNIINILSEQLSTFPESVISLRESMLKKVSAFYAGGFGTEGGRLMLTLSDGTQIPFSQASSGQNEALGIFMDLIDIVLKAPVNEGDMLKYSTLIIEEPEANLFPITQKTLVEAIAIAFNAIPGNQVLITTHSPYTLTVLNNLIAAWKGAHLKETGELNPATADEIAKVIPQPTWLNPAQVGAYYVADGGITSIMTETGLIGENELDSASEVIMEDFYRMLEIRREKERGAQA